MSIFLLILVFIDCGICLSRRGACSVKVVKRCKCGSFPHEGVEE